jgi:hypothetical protein
MVMTRSPRRWHWLAWAGYTPLLLFAVLLWWSCISNGFMQAKLILLAAVPVLGLFLAIWGWRGRRFGDEPFCAHCGYNLTGLSGAKCPETAT